MTDQPFPNVQVPLFGPKGVISPVWRNFLHALWVRTGGQTAANYANASGSVSQEFSVAPAMYSTQAVSLGQMQAFVGASGAAITPVTDTASPFSYSATQRGALAVSGGTVTGIALTREGVTAQTGLTSGMIPVSVGDVVTITYSAAPIISMVPA